MEDSTLSGDSRVSEPDTLKLDVIHSVIVDGLVFENNGDGVQVNIPRIYELAAYLDAWTLDDDVSPNVPPVPDMPPKPSAEQTTVIHSLCIKLGDMISHGPDIEKHHTVFEAVLAPTQDIESPCVLPPMVVKIAPQRGGRQLAQEAAMYDRLKALQGTMIPHCYGYLRCFVDLTKKVVVPWNEKVKFPRDEGTLDIFDLPNQSACLNLLLLEDAGIPVPREPSLRNELKHYLTCILKELSQHTVHYTDWRLANVLYVPGPCSRQHDSDIVNRRSQSPSPLEPHQMSRGTYRYRLIDFEDAQVPCIATDSSWIIRNSSKQIEYVVCELSNGE